MLRSAPIVALIILGVLLVADIVGVVACFILDVAPLRHRSTGLGYAVWFVLGVFAGVIAFSAAVDDGAPEAARRPLSERRSRARLVIAVALVLLIALTALFTGTFWSGAVEGLGVVPDHMPTTLVFFASFLAACALGYHMHVDDGSAASTSKR